MAIYSVYISNLRRTLQKHHGEVHTETGAQTVGEEKMTETATSTAPAAPEKQTISQKVVGLQTEKTALAASLNGMPEGAEKSAVQERISVIDRKLRWYAGRSGSASKPVKEARPSKSRSKKAPAPAAPSAPATASAANES